MARLIRSVWPFVLGVVASRLYMFWRIMPASEDAYITLRYSRNIARGLGPVFNASERVMGYTSPLWTALCSLPFALRLDPVMFARALSLGCDVLSLVLFWRLLERHSSITSARIFAFFFAAWPFFSALSASGLEMSAAIALLAVATSRPRWWALAPLFLIRPEGAAMAVLLSLWAKPRDRWLAAACILPVLLALALYYGSPIPHSVIAKASAYGHPGPLAAKCWWIWLLAPMVNGMPGEVIYLYLVSVLLLSGIVSAVSVLRKSLGTALGAAIAASGLVWLSYAMVGAAYFWWYMTLPLLCATLLASVGLPRIVKGRALYACAALCIACAWPACENLYTSRSTAESYTVTLADFIVSHRQPGQSLMAESVGRLGYQTDLRTMDMVGIVSPAPPRAPGWLGARIRAERPDWLVARYSEVSTFGGFGAAAPAFLSAADARATLADYEPKRWAMSRSGSTKPEPGDMVLLGRK